MGNEKGGEKDGKGYMKGCGRDERMRRKGGGKRDMKRGGGREGKKESD